MKYAIWEYLGRNTSGSLLNSANKKDTLKNWFYSGHNTPLSHHTDNGPMGLDHYNGLGEYCGPHTASSVFLILSLNYTPFRIKWSSV